MNHPFARAHGAVDFFVEADIGLHGGDAVVGKEHDVRVLLHQRRCAGVQLDDVPVVRVVLWRVKTLDVGVRDLHHGHATVVTQRVQPIDVLTPQSQCCDVAFAVTGVFDGSPSVIAAGFTPDKGLEPVNAVDWWG